MRISDIAEFKDKKNVFSLKETNSVFDAVQGMTERVVGSCVILDENEAVIGIFTERDLLTKIAYEGRDLKTTKLKEVMTAPPRTGYVEDSVLDSLRRMSQGRFRHLPIVDENNHLLGLLSQGDFVALTWGQLFHHLKQGTKTSFIFYTSLWILVIGILIYITVLLSLLTGKL